MAKALVSSRAPRGVGAVGLPVLVVVLVAMAIGCGGSSEDTAESAVSTPAGDGSGVAPAVESGDGERGEFSG